MKRISYIRTGVFLAALFTTMAVYSQQASSAYRSQIEQLNREMAQNMIQGNYEKSIDLYTNDAISLPSFEPMREGIDEIRKGMQDMASSGMKITSFEPKTTKVIPEGNIITEIGTYTMNATMPGSSQPEEYKGKYLNIWEKQPDGSLKIKVETWNTDVNPMEQSQSSGQGISQPDQKHAWPEKSNQGQSGQGQSQQPLPQTREGDPMQHTQPGQVNPQPGQTDRTPQTPTQPAMPQP